jgi:hypothetical protein
MEMQKGEEQMSCNQQMTPEQQATSNKLDAKILKYGSLTAWLEWERANNPEFEEKIYQVKPQKQNV